MRDPLLCLVEVESEPRPEKANFGSSLELVLAEEPPALVEVWVFELEIRPCGDEGWYEGAGVFLPDGCMKPG